MLQTRNNRRSKMTELQLDCALDLMRRLPPQQIEKNLSDLIDLVSMKMSMYSVLMFKIQVPDLCEDLLSSVDQPLKIARDKHVGKDYLLCDYNRDGDSYRCEVTRMRQYTFLLCFLFPGPHGAINTILHLRTEPCPARG